MTLVTDEAVVDRRRSIRADLYLSKKNEYGDFARLTCFNLKHSVIRVGDITRRL